ncbi:GNAT family protein [Saccharibacillus sp. CPCC 101409]|uniref:GNAT family N-acetyltransferase n=1 Tax=Saccharibacillus sp. CPCC 101409 TaxID=3058041 RepID=UPI002671D763|nr:GNAT family protein [Saccharibacillus sp. CPCC 101409]MDO3413333.1 GNAT family protein [Saccharibacillus sp. CPCC 101409]
MSSMPQEAEPKVELKFFRPEYEKALFEDYKVSEEQEKYTALPARAIQLCREDRDRHPIVIVAEGVPVGFFVLHRGDKIRSVTESPRAMLVRSLSVNLAEQGKGYAKRAMGLLPKFVSDYFPDMNEIVLVVNERNEAGMRVYEQAGFEDRGHRKQGPVGSQVLLHYRMNRK